jgi:hypothetical protein
LSNYTLNEKTETTNVSTTTTTEQSIAPLNDSKLNTFENDDKSDIKNSSTSETNSSIEMTLEANGEEKKLNGLSEEDSSEYKPSTNSNDLNVVSIKNESKENSSNKKEDSIKINSGIFLELNIIIGTGRPRLKKTLPVIIYYA